MIPLFTLALAQQPLTIVPAADSWLPHAIGKAAPWPSSKSPIARANGAIVLDRNLTVTNKLVNASRPFQLSQPQVALSDGRTFTIGHFADGLEGKTIDPQSGMEATYRFGLGDGDNYARETVVLKAQRDAMISRITLIDAEHAPGWRVAGTVEGSPVASASEFMGVEHPMSHSQVEGDRVRCWIDRRVPLHAGQVVTYSAVLGVAPKGQLRRAFLRYLERVRPRPYKPFLHYNCWYDLGWDKPYTAAECIDRINRFGQELSVKRGVKLSSFLFDDGWDDPNTTWNFNKGFPAGIRPLTTAAQRYGAGPGMWLSPWGGYGERRTQRLAAAKRNGYEVDSQGLALAGPRYYKRFHEVCLDLIRQGANQFKFDGTGSPDKQYPGSAFDSDFDAAITLIRDLRRAKPSLFVNLTTGTWPSPFWVLNADSIWRGGYDHNFAGVGTWRQKWITYRDGETYRNVVQRGPLYPLNSLMLHGIIYARFADHLGDDPGDDFADDVAAYFTTGTQLEEMYVTPTLLSSKDWDTLAAAARWAERFSAARRDVRWVGGDPLKLEVYGHAGWSGSSAYVELRNPSDKAQPFTLDIANELELPDGFRGSFYAVSGLGSPRLSRTFSPGRKVDLILKPFEVRTYDLQLSPGARAH